jgi:hypothetical protein
MQAIDHSKVLKSTYRNKRNPTHNRSHSEEEKNKTPQKQQQLESWKTPQFPTTRGAGKGKSKGKASRGESVTFFFHGSKSKSVQRAATGQ